MPLNAGAHVGSYVIVAPLGAGGMGEVYRARDAKLRRDVALKILPPLFAADPDRRARFTREAHVLASLNHPNIAAIYGVEEPADVTALVLELVDGPTLAECIARGPMPADDALAIAMQIAAALDGAHEKGIVHRDLKPANIKVTADGRVKVLDFGLAKALTDDTGPDAATSPTMTVMASRLGVIVGTAAYMAPEQAKGKVVDKRVDIWSFGCVLYEMLTGRRAFEGEAAAEFIVAVMTKEPDWAALPASTPPRVVELLRRCLKKDPRERLRDIGDAVSDIAAARTTTRVAVASVAARWMRMPSAWIAVAAVSLLAAAAVWNVTVRTPAAGQLSSRVLRYTISLPKRDQAEGLYFQFHLSPDGRYVAASGVVGDDLRGIFVRELDSLTWRLLPGTTTTDFFWSPDSREIAFFGGGRLRRVRASGGPPEEIAGRPGDFVEDFGSGAWGSTNVIVFSAAQPGGPLLQVPATGGTPRPATVADGGSHMYPEFLPDGRHFLYSCRGGSSPGVYVASLDNPAGRRLLADESSATFAPAADSGSSAHVIFVREGRLMAQRFDPSAVRLEGDAFVLAEHALFGDNGAGAVSVSANGVLLFLEGSSRLSDSRLVWFDRSGRRLGTEGPVGPPSPASLSPDGQTIATLRAQPGSHSGDIWLRRHGQDVGETRFTFDNAIASHSNIVWSPDGGRIAFSSASSGTLDLYVKDLRAATPKGEPLVRNANRKFVTDWSKNGVLSYTEIDPKTGADLWYVRMDAGRAGASPVPLMQTAFDESFGQISPDGHWLVYLSNESGSNEVYVRPFPSGTEKWKISAPLGTSQPTEPRWSRDGRELLYLTGPTGKYTMMTVPVRVARAAGLGRQAVFETGGSTPIFDVRANAFAPRQGLLFYSVSNDAQRFLIDHVESTAEPMLSVIVNWQRAFGAR